MEYYAVHTDDGLYHHGIKGQRWGVRRYQNADGSVTAAGAKRYYTNGNEGQQKVGQSRMKMDQAKANYKSANRQANKSYYDYDSKRFQKFSLNKNKREANKERFNKAVEDLRKASDAKSSYKDAKKAYKAEKKAYKVDQKAKINENFKKIQETSSTKDRLLYNDVTRRQAAKYMAKNNMSLEDAKAKANKNARRNTAIYLAAMGALTYKTMKG